MSAAKLREYNPDKIEAAKQADKKFVELVEDHASGRPIWLSIANITAVYSPEDGKDGGEERP